MKDRDESVRAQAVYSLSEIGDRRAIGRARHIVEAERHGLGSLHPEVVGDDPGSYVMEFKTPSGLKANAVLW